MTERCASCFERERLAALTKQPLQRIVLREQRPIEEVARFLVGTGAVDEGGKRMRDHDIGHRRELDLAIEIPNHHRAVMSNEVWKKSIIGCGVNSAHRTTLVFVNTSAWPNA